MLADGTCGAASLEDTCVGGSSPRVARHVDQATAFEREIVGHAFLYPAGATVQARWCDKSATFRAGDRASWSGRSLQLEARSLHDRSRLHDAVLGDDDDAVTDVIAIAVGMIELGEVRQPGAVADARVLVDDDAVQHDVASDAE